MEKAVLPLLIILLLMPVMGLEIPGLSGKVEIQEGNRNASSTSVFTVENGLEMPLELLGIFIVFLLASVYALDLDPSYIAISLFLGFLFLVSIGTSLPWFVAPAILILVLLFRHIGLG